MPKPAYAGEWRAIRLYVLARDNHTCQIRLPGCTHIASCVDHILDVADGGTHTDTNLRASCRHCNSVKGGQRRQRKLPTPSRRW